MEWKYLFSRDFVLPCTPRIMYTGGHLCYQSQNWVCSRILTRSHSISSLNAYWLQRKNRTVTIQWRNHLDWVIKLTSPMRPRQTQCAPTVTPGEGYKFTCAVSRKNVEPQPNHEETGGTFVPQNKRYSIKKKKSKRRVIFFKISKS